VRTEAQIIREMNRALDLCDDRAYDRLFAELRRVRATNKWKGINASR